MHEVEIRSLIRLAMLHLLRLGVWMVAVSILIGLVGCNQQAGTRADEENEEEPEGPTYENPVLARDFPDPPVLRGPDDTYYVYGTETLNDAEFYNIQVAQSQDLVNWSWEGDSPSHGVEWAQDGRSYWAPHVVYDAEQERYLFYSGDNWCGENADYAVMVARASGPMGPFETLGEASGTNRSTILTANQTWKGPGHNSVIQGSEGADWLVHHVINRDQPTRTTGTGARPDRRVMLMD